jgi:hypothetical protein
MRQLSITPSITVTIGRHTRIYYAFVTTAPPTLDSPNTITLDEGRFSDIVGHARDEISDDELRGPQPARLVLVDAMQRDWQEAKYAGNHHLLLPADPWLAGLDTLQHWLWQRLQARTTNSVAA